MSGSQWSSIMRTAILGVVAMAALVSLPANADHRYYRGGYYSRPYLSFGYSYGYPFAYPYYGRPGYYYPSSLYGFGIQLGPRYPVKRSKADRDDAKQQALKLYVYPAAGQNTL